MNPRLGVEILPAGHVKFWYGDTMRQPVDQESEYSLQKMEEATDKVVSRFQGIRKILVILSSHGIVYDVHALRQKILHAYPGAGLFFETPLAQQRASWCKVDLLIDFTGPGERERYCQAKKLRSMARIAVGRNAGWYRKRIYDFVCDEKPGFFGEEGFVQRQVLNLAGVAWIPSGVPLPDVGASIALGLPSMQGL